jgi:RES domain-containing protein
MRVYRIGKCQFIKDLSGTGAALYGGRWNSKGVYVLYTAASPSLALLETVVHLTKPAAGSFCMLCLELPERSVEVKKAPELPTNWNLNPPPDDLKKIGDLFISSCASLAVQLPSLIMAEENNILLNPAHTDFAKVKIVYVKPLPLDERLLPH